MKLTSREKYFYGTGVLKKNLICYLVGTYLMYYFTDVLILAPAFVEEYSFCKILEVKFKIIGILENLFLDIRI